MNEGESITISKILMIGRDEDSGGIAIANPGGRILTHKEFRILFESIQHFYDCTSDEEIAQANAENAKGFRDEPRDTPAKPPRPGWVYLLKSPDGLYKIGKTLQGPKQRPNEIACKAPFEVNHICSIKAEDARGMETELHQRFADKRVRGEWFKLNEQDLSYILGLQGVIR